MNYFRRLIQSTQFGEQGFGRYCRIAKRGGKEGNIGEQENIDCICGADVAYIA